MRRPLTTRAQEGSRSELLEVTVIQTDGNIVAAGFTAISGKDDFMLARYLGSATTTAAAVMSPGAEPAPSTPRVTSIGVLIEALPAASSGMSPIDPTLVTPTGPLALPGLAARWRPKGWTLTP
jgi:hypothetical protein